MTTTTTLSLSLGFGLLLVAGVLACGSSAEPAFKEATGLPFHVSGILFAALALTLFGKSSALRLPCSLARFSGGCGPNEETDTLARLQGALAWEATSCRSRPRPATGSTSP